MSAIHFRLPSACFLHTSRVFPLLSFMITVSAVLVFPVALFSFRNPFHCGCDSFIPGLRTLCFSNPFDIFPLGARGKRLKEVCRLLAALKSSGECIRNFKNCPWRFHHFLSRGDGAGILPAVYKPCRLPDPA